MGQNPTYAMGRALRHLLDVSWPCAMIFLGSPSKRWHSGSFLMMSTARLKLAILLSGAKTSVKSR